MCGWRRNSRHTKQRGWKCSVAERTECILSGPACQISYGGTLWWGSELFTLNSGVSSALLFQKVKEGCWLLGPSVFTFWVGILLPVVHCHPERLCSLLKARVEVMINASWTQELQQRGNLLLTEVPLFFPGTACLPRALWAWLPQAECLCVECNTPWTAGPNGVWEGAWGVSSCFQLYKHHTLSPSTQGLSSGPLRYQGLQGGGEDSTSRRRGTRRLPSWYQNTF